jgi:uridine kinase
LSIVLRDVKYRGRDIEGCIKQWFSFVKPNFHKYVQPQREVADIIVPRGIENKVAIGLCPFKLRAKSNTHIQNADMVSERITKTLELKSEMHQVELQRLDKNAENHPLSENVHIMESKPQMHGINTILFNPATNLTEFIFYFDRMAALLVERATAFAKYEPEQIITPQNTPYMGLKQTGEISAVVLLRGGSVLETGLKRVIPDCKTGRILIQTNPRTGEPELHYRQLSPNVEKHDLVMVLDAQMSSGGAALMAVKVLVDHGVPEDRIVFVAYLAGRLGLGRLLSVFPEVRVVVCKIEEDADKRWVEEKYLGC